MTSIPTSMAQPTAQSMAQSCPYESDDKPSASSTSSSGCGLNAQLMEAARQSSGFVVRGDSGQLLSTDRVTSSIPKSDFTPPHQRQDAEYWEYPSESMYFKAMQRKGWDPEAQQMNTIVAIHNSVNEQSWREILQWEQLHSRDPSPPNPKLKRFCGRPRDFSPKARLMNWLGYSLPFDRHDWVIEREDGSEVRYVIDFYSGHPEPGRPLSVYLDVRPALDSVESFIERLHWQYHDKVLPLLPFRGMFLKERTTPSTPVASASTTTVRTASGADASGSASASAAACPHQANITAK